ncbi:MAG: polyprenyl synthetase family protein [Nitrospirota bacterium]
MKDQILDMKKIFAASARDLGRVEEALMGLFQSQVLFIPAIGKHLVQSGGKRLRPLFLLSGARLAGYGGDEHITLAAIIEAIHTASLLHDDVVDQAELRRGRPTAHSLWGNQVVVLVGDYLYSNALREAVLLRKQRIMETLSEATTRMTQGELLQLEKVSDTTLTEEDYLEIIKAKTGVLISAACRSAGILAGLTPRKEEALAAYGLRAGTAFQMADDVLDYMAHEDDLGKRLGKDLDEGKITLPLICLLRAVTEAERVEINDIVEGDLTEEGLRRVMELFTRYDALTESMGKARALVEEAKAELLVFPPSTARDEMFEIAEYALQREK